MNPGKHLSRAVLVAGGVLLAWSLAPSDSVAGVGHLSATPATPVYLNGGILPAVAAPAVLLPVVGGSLPSSVLPHSDAMCSAQTSSGMSVRTSSAGRPLDRPITLSLPDTI